MPNAIAKPDPFVKLTPGKRVLFLTKDSELIRKQLFEGLNLKMTDVKVEDLMDDINTDAMTPAWLCFNYLPDEIAKNAYAGLTLDGKRVIPERALYDGNFEVIVSGLRKGVGSSRETAVQAEKWSGIKIAIAASFAPIHARNNINQGVLMGDHAMLNRLQAGESIPRAEFAKGLDPVTALQIEYGGLFPFTAALAAGEVKLPAHATGERPMNIAEKILALHMMEGAGQKYVKPGDSVAVTVDGGYSHEFTTAQVHYFLQSEFGKDYKIKNPQRFAVFEDHLIYADGVEAMAKHSPLIQQLRDMQREFQRHTGCLDFSAKDSISPGICHQVAREQIIEPGDFIQATDSHTCMGGGSNALAYGVGATEYAALVHSGVTFVEVPESIRFELEGDLQPGVTAKDVMLHILLHYAKPQATLNRVMEFGGPGLRSLSMDERATLANMATECSAKAGVVEADAATIEWIRARRPMLAAENLKSRCVAPNPGAEYAGGVHLIDLEKIAPMVATPGDAAKGVPSDPTNGAFVRDIGEVKIDIAYGGSCTAGKEDDLDMYAKVCAEAVRAGKKVAPGVEFMIQFGSERVEKYARGRGYAEIFEQAGVKIIHPGCGACIGCGPGVSVNREQVSVSAINRNFQNRSGPGKLYLASPLTVAASAFTGIITAYRAGMFN
jgi:3-isopropylmalate/(R)-2-methylmalate dehydratase large subunit